MNPVLIYLMRIEGISVNIEAAPNEKQWAKILEWTEELKASQTVQASQPAVSQGTAPVLAPASNGTASPTDLMAQVAELKRSGQAKAAAGAGPVALDAGPPPAAIRKK